MFCVDPQKRMNCEDVLGHTYCQPFGQSPSLPPQDVCEDAGKSTGWERISSLDYNDEWEDIESFKHAPRIENASELADVLENFELPVGVQDPRALLGWSAPEHPAPPTPPSPASRLRRKSPCRRPRTYFRHKKTLQAQLPLPNR